MTRLVFKWDEAFAALHVLFVLDPEPFDEHLLLELGPVQEVGHEHIQIIRSDDALDSNCDSAPSHDRSYETDN